MGEGWNGVALQLHGPWFHQRWEYGQGRNIDDAARHTPCLRRKGKPPLTDLGLPPSKLPPPSEPPRPARVASLAPRMERSESRAPSIYDPAKEWLPAPDLPTEQSWGPAQRPERRPCPRRWRALVRVPTSATFRRFSIHAPRGLLREVIIQRWIWER